MIRRILIFADSKWRDAPGCALLKHTLEQELENVSVLVCSFHLWEDAINFFNPHLVFLNHIQGKRNKRIASHVKRHGGSVAVLFNEGLLEFESKKPIFEAQVENSDVCKFFAWNEVIAHLMDDRAVVTGSPRFDFYPPVDDRALVCQKFGLNPIQPLVVFGDSWPSAKFQYSHQQFHEQNWNDLGNTAAAPWANAKEFAQHQFDLQERFKLMILNIRGELDVQIAVKTHPMSDYFKWSDWGQQNGIEIIHSAYIFDVLNAADAYVTKAGSITVAEAWLSGTPVVKLATDYDDGSTGEQFACDDLNAGFNDALDWVNEALVGDIVGDYDPYLRKWGLVSQNASVQIAREAEPLLDRASPPNPDLPRLFSAIQAHDVRYGRPVVDGFGNYDKAVTQSDVNEWITSWH